MKDVEFDYSYLRGFIKEHYGNNAKFADFLGIGTTALYDKLANKSSFSQKEIYKTIQKHGLSEHQSDLLFFKTK